MTNLLLEEPAARAYPNPSPDEQGLTEGSWLLYAIACRWISDLIYVHLDNDAGPEEFAFILKDLKPGGDAIQLRSIRPAAFSQWSRGGYGDDSDFGNIEPDVPYERRLWREFHAEERYDFLCLTRSPRYAPVTADPLYDLIVETFIDPIAVG
jgi:hypothetical protein